RSGELGPAAAAAAEIEPLRARRQRLPREDAEVRLEDALGFRGRKARLIELRPLRAEAVDGPRVCVLYRHEPARGLSQRRRLLHVSGVFSFRISRSRWYLNGRAPRDRIQSIIWRRPVSSETLGE